MPELEGALRGRRRRHDRQVDTVRAFERWIRENPDDIYARWIAGITSDLAECRDAAQRFVWYRADRDEGYVSEHRCGRRACIHCQSDGARKRRRIAEAMVSPGETEVRVYGRSYTIQGMRQAKHVVLTFPSIQTTDPGELSRHRASLMWCARKLRQRKFWKDRVRGGMVAVERTWNPDEGYHLHLHMLADARFLPTAKHYVAIPGEDAVPWPGMFSVATEAPSGWTLEYQRSKDGKEATVGGRTYPVEDLTFEPEDVYIRRLSLPKRYALSSKETLQGQWYDVTKKNAKNLVPAYITWVTDGRNAASEVAKYAFKPMDGDTLDSDALVCATVSEHRAVLVRRFGSYFDLPRDLTCHEDGTPVEDDDAPDLSHPSYLCVGSWPDVIEDAWSGNPLSRHALTAALVGRREGDGYVPRSVGSRLESQADEMACCGACDGEGCGKGNALRKDHNRNTPSDCEGSSFRSCVMCEVSECLDDYDDDRAGKRSAEVGCPYLTPCDNGQTPV